MWLEHATFLFRNSCCSDCPVSTQRWNNVLSTYIQRLVQRLNQRWKDVISTLYACSVSNEVNWIYIDILEQTLDYKNRVDIFKRLSWFDKTQLTISELWSNVLLSILRPWSLYNVAYKKKNQCKDVTSWLYFENFFFFFFFFSYIGQGPRNYVQ